MPTAYTAGIENGSLTSLREYALLCAREFGALVYMRDEPLKNEIRLPTSDGYYEKSYENATKAYADWMNLTEEEKRTLWNAEYAETIADVERRNEKTRIELERYKRMRTLVAKWIPPTTEHFELKTFMLQQINASTEWMKEYEIPQQESFESWSRSHEKILFDSLGRAAAGLEKDKHLIRRRTEWITALMNSLPPK